MRQYGRRRMITAWKVNKKLIRFQKRLKRAEELKFKDVSVADQSVGASGIGPLFLSGLNVGAGKSNRIGRKVILKYLFFRLSIWMPSGATADATNVVRIIIFTDKLANGRTPTFTGQDTGILTTLEPLSARNIDTGKRFRILWEAFFGLTYGGNQVRVIKKNLKLGLMATFSGDTDVSTNQVTNSVWVCAITDSGSIEHPLLNIRFRLRWIDL